MHDLTNQDTHILAWGNHSPLAFSTLSMRMADCNTCQIYPFPQDCSHYCARAVGKGPHLTYHPHKCGVCCQWLSEARRCHQLHKSSARSGRYCRRSDPAKKSVDKDFTVFRSLNTAYKFDQVLCPKSGAERPEDRCCSAHSKGAISSTDALTQHRNSKTLDRFKSRPSLLGRFASPMVSNVWALHLTQTALGGPLRIRLRRQRTLFSQSKFLFLFLSVWI